MVGIQGSLQSPPAHTSKIAELQISDKETNKKEDVP